LFRDVIAVFLIEAVVDLREVFGEILKSQTEDSVVVRIHLFAKLMLGRAVDYLGPEVAVVDAGSARPDSLAPGVA
jgi:hypothetical protein